MICYKGKVLTVDSNDTVAGFLVEDKGRIVYVGNELPEQYKNVQTVELGKKVLVPAFVDTHQHMASFSTFHAGLNVMDAESNEEIAQMFDKTFSEDEEGGTDRYGDMVVVKDIDIFSYCEHHLALMYDMKVTVAYVPNGKVIGLSKIARIADMVAKRLQLQERIGTDIADIITQVTGSEDVAVYIEGCHSCMTARGIRKTNTKTYTQTLRGRFQNESNGFMQWWR